MKPGEFRALSLGSLVVILAIAIGWTLVRGDGDEPADTVADAGTAAAPASTTTPAAEDSFPEGTIDGPVMRYLPPLTDESDMAEIRGTLVLEGDCLLVDSPWDTRFPVVWPAGTTWDAEGEAVVLHSGERFEIGSEIRGGGGYGGAGGLAEWLGDEVAALAAMCVEGDYEEVAFLGNTPRSVRAD